MANYRPKSLEELNSVYDKTLSSQNVIKDSASAISTAAFTDTPAVSAQSIDDFFAEQTDATVGTCADLTQDIKNFIKDFGKPATKEDEIAIRRKPVPREKEAMIHMAGMVFLFGLMIFFTFKDVMRLFQ